jgi:magnesium transporter
MPAMTRRKGEKSHPEAPPRRPRRPPHIPAPGTPPGQIHVDPNAPKPLLRLMAYGPDAFEEREGIALAELDDYLGRWPVTWLDVAGLGDGAVLAALGQRFGIHRLAMEDVSNVGQRPKVEAYPGHFLVVIRQPWKEDAFRTEQISLFTGPDWVLSFQEDAADCFGPVRARIRETGRTIRKMGPDYLCYALIDSIVDSYLPILERLGEEMEALQDGIMEHPRPANLSDVYDAKHALSAMRRAAWPMREMLNSMIRDPLPGLTDETRIYLRDCYDHAILVLEFTESYRDMGSELMDFYLSSVGYRTNEIVKVLTITGALFIPLTFVAGIYGMNFNTEISPWNMPELNWYFGYPLAMGGMLAIAAVMLLYFKRKGWLG